MKYSQCPSKPGDVYSGFSPFSIKVNEGLSNNMLKSQTWVHFIHKLFKTCSSVPKLVESCPLHSSPLILWTIFETESKIQRRYWSQPDPDSRKSVPDLTFVELHGPRSSKMGNWKQLLAGELRKNEVGLWLFCDTQKLSPSVSSAWEQTQFSKDWKQGNICFYNVSPSPLLLPHIWIPLFMGAEEKFY